MTAPMKLATATAALAAALLLAPGCKRSPPADAPATPAPAAAPHGPAGPTGAAAAPHGPAGAPADDMHAGAAPGGQEPVTEAMRAVFAYPVTLARAETYARAVKEIRAAGEKDEKLMARLRAPKPAGDQQAELARWLEGIPQLKAILDKHGLKGIDLVLMPQALMQGRIAYAAGKDGATPPPDRTSATSLALHKADWPKMDALLTGIMADLKVISGK
jgi:hypothetical protein